MTRSHIHRLLSLALPHFQAILHVSHALVIASLYVVFLAYHLEIHGKLVNVYLVRIPCVCILLS